MDKDTLVALKDSIEHWKRLRRDPLGNEESPWGEHCALCVQVCSKCDYCLVFEKTGQRQCVGSPWYQARIRWDHVRQFIRDNPAEPWLRVLVDYRKHAAGEIKFLQSLLPPEETA